MTTKKELEEEIVRINTRAYNLEVKFYAENQRLYERIINQENNNQGLAEMYFVGERRHALACWYKDECGKHTYIPSQY